LPARTGAAGKYKAQVEPLYQRITRAIRDIDSRHLIIVEGVDWANDWSIFTRPFDSNLVYQFHYYCWDNPTRLKSIRRYLDYRDKLQAPVWVGETGERDNTIYWGTTDYFEANNIGWSFWPWKKLDANNAPCSIKGPADWDAVAAYSRGGPKPSAARAQKAFDEFLLNIRLTNCIQHLDVVNALLRRLPVRIEAENFGHGGQNGSYFVTDTNRHAEFYRTEQPVIIKQSDTPGRRSGQHISLTENEWTAYRFNNAATGSFSITLRVKAEHGSAEAELVSEGRALPVTISPKEWTEIKLGPVSLKAGGGEFKWLIKRGAVYLDWLDVTEGRQ
jgi:endoglucanase